MNYYIFISIILLSFSLNSCKYSTETSENKTIHGIWVHQDYKQDGSRVLKKIPELDENNYGFKIDTDGRFIERKNIGFCGTPPITYGNFDGKWRFLSNDSIGVEVNYWGGTTSYSFKIISITDNTLNIRYYYQ